MSGDGAKQSPKVLQASGPSTAIIHFNPTKLSGLRHEQVSDLSYHIARLLTGERTAVTEWTLLGITIECEPDMDQGDEA